MTGTSRVWSGANACSSSHEDSYCIHFK